MNSGGAPAGNADGDSLNCGLGEEEYLGIAVGFAVLHRLAEGFEKDTALPFLTTVILSELFAAWILV